jgi:hypothetical protein
MSLAAANLVSTGRRILPISVIAFDAPLQNGLPGATDTCDAFCENMADPGDVKSVQAAIHSQLARVGTRITDYTTSSTRTFHTMLPIH